MKTFKDLIKENSDNELKLELQKKIDKLRIKAETSSEPEIVQLEIDALYRQLDVYLVKN